MTIGSAVQKGEAVYVYDERGAVLTVIAIGAGPTDGLKGFTGGAVVIQRGNVVYTYDERGNVIATTPIF